MSLTRLEDEGLPKNPNLQIAEWKFLLQKPDLIDKELIRFQLMNAITMGSKYTSLLHLSTRIKLIYIPIVVFLLDLSTINVIVEKMTLKYVSDTISALDTDCQLKCQE